jgi:ABC-2 type transport system ATP-binding protein
MKSVIAENLVKTYRNGEVRALDGLSLEIEEGTVLSVLGPNGSGKTTTVRVLATLLKPDSGRAMVGGIDVVKNPKAVREIIGLSGQYAAVDETLTGWDNLVMFGRLYHLSSQAANARAEELLEQFSLADDAKRPIKTFSGGMRRRLDLAASLIIRPKVLFLDEPTTGLDPRGRMEMWKVIEGLVKDGVTLLLTTQYLEEADQLADEIAVIDRGRVIARGTSDQLKTQVGGERLELIVAEGDIARAREIADRVGGTTSTVDAGLRKISTPVTTGGEALVGLLRELDNAKIHPLDIALKRPSLDDVFMSLTGHVAEELAEEGGPQSKKSKKRGGKK